MPLPQSLSFLGTDQEKRRLWERGRGQGKICINMIGHIICKTIIFLLPKKN